jgi:hypothetical protein
MTFLMNDELSIVSSTTMMDLSEQHLSNSSYCHCHSFRRLCVSPVSKVLLSAIALTETSRLLVDREWSRFLLVCSSVSQILVLSLVPTRYRTAGAAQQRCS